MKDAGHSQQCSGDRMTAPSGWPVPTPQELADWKDRHWPVPPVQDPVRNPWLQPLKTASVRVQQEKARAA